MNPAPGPALDVPSDARPPLRLVVLGVVSAGGAIGALTRHGLGSWIPAAAEGFPWTTFVINLVGTTLLALLPAFAVVRRRALLPPFLGAGVLGGFTTMSAYSEEARALAAAGHLGTAATYVLGTLAACLAAVAVADRFSSRRDRATFAALEGDL